MSRLCIVVPGLLLILACVLPQAGCGGPSQPNQQLNLFAWSEYIPQDVVDGFTRETGIRVNYETYSSNEEMLSKLLTGVASYDLIQPSDYTAEDLAKEGRLLPLDKSRLPNLRHLDPELMNLPFDPEQKYTVPFMSGTVGIVYNSERVTEPVTGYADLFSGRYDKRIVIVDDAREMVSWALASLGIPINEVTPENLERARPVLRKWLPQVKVFDSDSPKDKLAAGDVDLGVVWSGEAARLIAEDPRFKYVLPAEGAHRFIDTLAIPAGARNVEAAHRFLDYILRPEVSVLISKEFPYTNPNLEARKLLSPEELANPASYPPGQQKLDYFRGIGKNANEVSRLVTEVRGGG